MADVIWLGAPVIYPKPYYNLLVRDEDGIWAPQFGCYSLEVVRQERQDYRDHDVRAKDLQIVKSSGALPHRELMALIRDQFNSGVC